MMASRLTRRSFGPGLVDEHHAAVEIALLAGEALIDRVGDDVRDAPPVVRRGEILLAGELLCWPARPTDGTRALRRPSGWRVQPAGHQRLRVDRAPVGEARLARRWW